MEDKKDILEEMRKEGMPYRLPEAYFDDLPQRMTRLAKEHGTGRGYRTGHTKVLSLAAVAVALLLLVTGGAFLLVHSDRELPEQGTLAGLTAASQMSGDEILEYLIYSDARVEEFEDLIEE